MVWISDDYAIYRDRLQWILVEKPKEAPPERYKKEKVLGRKWFYPNLATISRAIIELEARDALGRLAPSEEFKDAVRMPQEALITHIETELEKFLTRIINETKVNPI